MSFFDNFKKKNLIAAHRGYSQKYPENTLIALRSAVDKADLIEFDVQFSKDNIPIIFHDENLSRTSDVEQFEEFLHRKPYNICDFNYSELLKLDIGSWFDSKETFDTQRILSLEEVLKCSLKNETYLNIEIKDVSNTKNSSLVVDEVLFYLKKYDCEKRVLISSFNHEYLREIKKLNSSIETAALAYKFHPENLIEYLKDLKVCSYHIDNETVTKSLVEELNKHNIWVNVYTANLKKRQSELFNWGVKIVFTDRLKK